MTLRVTGDDGADELLRRNPLALLIGMLLDQQIAIELAFKGPSRLAERMPGPLDAATVAQMPIDDLAELFSEKPALHRFPASMAKRTLALSQFLVDRYEGEAATVWTGVESGPELLRRLKALPGFGPEKSKIFVALLAKQFGVRPVGWEEAAGAFSDDVPRSIADVDDPSVLAEIRAYRKSIASSGKPLNKER